MDSLGIETVNIGLPGAGPRACADTEALAREIAPISHEEFDPTAPRAPTKTISAPSPKSPSAQAWPSKPPRFSAPAPSAAWLKIGPSITSNAPRRKPSNSPSATACPRCSSPKTPPAPTPTPSAASIPPPSVPARPRSSCATPSATPRPWRAYSLVKFVVKEVVNPSRRQDSRRLARSQRPRPGGCQLSGRLSRPAHDQVHAAANSLGERVGNTPMELMLVNLRLLGIIDRDLSPPEANIANRRPRHAHHHPAKLSCRWPRRLPHRHRSPRRRHHQSLPQSRSRSRRHHL